MHFELSSEQNTKYTVISKLSDKLYLNSDVGWNMYNTKNAVVYFKGYQISDYNDLQFIDKIIENPTPY